MIYKKWICTDPKVDYHLVADTDSRHLIVIRGGKRSNLSWIRADEADEKLALRRIMLGTGAWRSVPVSNKDTIIFLKHLANQLRKDNARLKVLLDMV